MAGYLYPPFPAGLYTLESRVLIADTDAELRQRLYRRLLDIDVFSDCAANAGEALQKLDENTTYGVILVDAGLPHGGVERVVDRIDRMERAQRPIVIVLAAVPQSTRSLDVEIVQIVLRRPVDLTQLVDVVQSCIRSTAAGRQRRASSPEAGRVRDQPMS